MRSTRNIDNLPPKFSFVLFESDQKTMILTSTNIIFKDDNREGTVRWKGKNLKVWVLKMSGKQYALLCLIEIKKEFPYYFD